jgi:transcriptional regulator with XRE-family HTH domain
MRTGKAKAIDAQKIKLRRKALGCTMEEAARLSGIGHKQNWNKLESGKQIDCAASTLRKLAKFFHCRMEDLMLPEPTNSKASEAPEP